MSTPRNRPETTPVTTPVRQDAVCMCVHGQACSSYAPGHAVHLIQARLVSATASEWIDAIVSAIDPADGTVTLRTLDGVAVQLWNGAGAAEALTVGAPVAWHERYHTLAVGRTRFNVLSV